MEEEKSMRTLVVALIGLFLLAGCSSTVKRVEVSTKPIERPQLVVPKIDPISQKEVEFIIITEENYQEVFARLKEMKVDPILIGVTDEGYENIGLNFAETQRIIRQYKAVIAAYEAYYIEAEQALTGAEKNLSDVENQVDAQNERNQDEQDSKFSLDKLNPFN